MPSGTSRSVLRRLPAEQAVPQVTSARHRLPRQFGTAQLVMLGLGVMIGAGIFSLAGKQAAANAGPAVLVSFLLASFVCLLAALSYAELSSTIPAAGSVYTFSYVAFGELWGWLVGWALILELLVAAALVARVWSAYFVATIDGFGLPVPDWLGQSASVGEGLNWVGFGVLALLTLMVVTGTKLSARVLSVVVVAKVAVILFVIVVGARYVSASNYTPFVPERVPAAEAGGGTTVLQLLLGSSDTFGLVGVFTATGVIVFAYIGFDLIATAAEEAVEPRRSIPRSMLISLGLVTVLYLAMAAVLVGLRPHTELGGAAPVTEALTAAGVTWAADLVNLGALLALTTVILVLLIAQSRLLFAMGRDRLLPEPLGRVSSLGAPGVAAGVAGTVAALVALYPGLADLEQLLVIGALFAFLFCAVGVIWLRHSQPDLERGFRVPWVPALPLLSALATVWLMLNLTTLTWRNFGVWMTAGLVLYLAYGRRTSNLADRAPVVRQGTHAMR
jgi:APA family basic amino acid/polyamine antiporter